MLIPMVVMLSISYDFKNIDIPIYLICNWQRSNVQSLHKSPFISIFNPLNMANHISTALMFNHACYQFCNMFFFFLNFIWHTKVGKYWQPNFKSKNKGKSRRQNNQSGSLDDPACVKDMPLGECPPPPYLSI